MVVSPERAVPRRNRFVVTTQLAPRLRGWISGVRGYDARIWRICDAAAALLFAADAVVVDAAAAAAASRSDGRPTDEGVLPEVGGELDHFVAAKCAVCFRDVRYWADRGAGEICVWFDEEKQEFNRHEESSFVFWGVGRAQERERRC